MVDLKNMLKEYVQLSLKMKNLKIEKQKIGLEIKQHEMNVLNLQDQILQLMDMLGVTEDEINLGNNTIVKKGQVKKTKGVSLKAIEEEFVKQNGNAISFNQILNTLKERNKSAAEIKPVLKLKIPTKLV